MVNGSPDGAFGIPDGAFGATLEAGGKPFDPLNLAQWRDFDQLRATELRNGRVAMLASTGWVWPQIFGKFASDDIATTDPIKAMSEISPEGAVQILVTMGVFEVLNYKHDWSTGKSLWDPLALMPKTEAGKKAMMEKELKNGRLAMIAFASFLSAHYIPGSVPALGPDFV